MNFIHWISKPQYSYLHLILSTFSVSIMLEVSFLLGTLIAFFGFLFGELAMKKFSSQNQDTESSY